MQRSLLVIFLLLLNMAAFAFLVRPVFSEEDEIFGIAASPDGEFLALSASYGVRVYDLPTGEFRYELREESDEHGQGVRANIAWSPNGAYLAMGKPQEGVRIWDTASWEIVAEQAPYEDDYNVPGFAWSPDSSQLAVGTGYKMGIIQIWVPETDMWESLSAYSGQQVSLVWASDDQLLVMADQALFDARTGTLVRDFQTQIDGANAYALWSPNKTLAFVFFDLGGSLLNSQTNEREGFGACCYPEIAWSMDGKYFAATSNRDNEIWVWDTEADEVVVQERQGDIIYAFAWLPNDELLAVGALDGVDTVWNTTTGETLFHP